MSGADRDAFRADLARAGIVLPPHDFEAAARIMEELTRAAGRVRDHLERADGDASG